MMLPQRECAAGNKQLPFVSMVTPKHELGYNSSKNKVYVNNKKLKPIVKVDKKQLKEDKMFPLENYRKLRTTQQFWKKNENPLYTEYNRKIDKNENEDNKNDEMSYKTIYKTKTKLKNINKNNKNNNNIV